MQPPSTSSPIEPSVPPSALIVWGGWEGHEPARAAEMFAGHLRRRGWEVAAVAGVEELPAMNLVQYSVIVPI